MELVRKDNGTAVLHASLDELVLMANMANEAIEAVEDWEFSTRLGFDKEVARNVARQLAIIADNMLGHSESD